MSEAESVKNELLGALIGLVKAAEHKSMREQISLMVAEGLAVCHAAEKAKAGNEDESVRRMREILERVRAEKLLIAPNCASCVMKCGNTDDFDVTSIAGERMAVRDAKQKILTEAQRIARIVQEALQKGIADEAVKIYFHKALSVVSYFDMSEEELLAVAAEATEIEQRCQL